MDGTLLLDPAPQDTPVQQAESAASELMTVFRQITALTARMTRLLRTFDERRDAQRLGYDDTIGWLMSRLGLSFSAARDHVRVARALGELPRIEEAFAAGDISYSKVRAIVRVAEPENEDLLLGWARRCSASQLERLVSGFLRARPVADVDRRHSLRSLRWYYDEEGCLVLRARLTPEDGATVVRAVEEALKWLDLEEPGSAAAGGSARSADSAEPDAVPAPATDDLTTPSEQRAADALVAVAEHFLAAEPRSLVGHQRAVVLVHARERAADAPDAPDASPDLEFTSLGDLASIHPDTARRILCDAGVVRTVPSSMSVGRSRRTVPDAMHRALTFRDRRCRFPGCSVRRTDAHHIVHWSQGGETSIDNLVLLCRRHHRSVHEGGYRLRLLPDAEVEVLRPDGAHVLVGLESAGRGGPM